ncbi:hypothetical protein LY625_06780 [Lysobacter sp. GX 14042]|uniref:hypothetical protein n=1 Tax=Lysobacter sp. GX 14042 TaxID=2907155 RepID=UPI001F1B7D55|nr:hypothetical protein [Lysobacter sp. GX 14042]MCE7032326.1 hypothetical protein [Lysobacter sp. GX 14042]
MPSCSPALPYPLRTRTANLLTRELERLDDTLDEAVSRAGQGEDPRFARRAGAHLRRLADYLDADAYAAAEQALEDARRLLDAAEPAAPLLMLEHSRARFADTLRRMRRLHQAA